MSTTPSPFPSEDKNKENKHLILPGLLLILLGLCGWLTVNLIHARNELVLLRQEIQATKLALKDADQRIEADRVIIRRQIDLLREAEAKLPPETK